MTDRHTNVLSFPSRYYLSDWVRRFGLHVVASRGHGKSTLLGRGLAFGDFVRDIPVVLIDQGDAIDAFLARLCGIEAEVKPRTIPPEVLRYWWSRVRYVDMGNTEQVMPFPLYYQLGTESLATMTQRFIEVVRRVDPALQQAPLHGINAIEQLAVESGMILTALGYQVTEMKDLLLHLPNWTARIEEARKRNDDTADAYSFFTEQFPKWPASMRWQNLNPLLNKIGMFTREKPTKAMVGAPTPGILWDEVLAKKQIVLLDFRNVHDATLRRFFTAWTFQYLLTFIRYRGAHQQLPLSIIIDELAALANVRTSEGAGLLQEDLDELLNVLMRRYNLWLTLGHQEMYQFPDEKTQKLLLGMGTQIFGATADMDAALLLARQFFRIDPLAVKRYETVWGSENYLADPRDRIPHREYFELEKRPVEYTIEEQHYLQAYKIGEQPPFQFFVSFRNHTAPLQLPPRQQYMVDAEQMVPDVRETLMQRYGLPVPEVLAAIAKRRPGQEQPSALQPPRSALPAPADGRIDTSRLHDA